MKTKRAMTRLLAIWNAKSFDGLKFIARIVNEAAKVCNFAIAMTSKSLELISSQIANAIQRVTSGVETPAFSRHSRHDPSETQGELKSCPPVGHLGESF